MCANAVELIDPLSDTRWDSFVTNHPSGSIYQHSCWLKVISLTHKHVEPLCFIIEDEGCNIRAAIPCFIVKSMLTGTRIVSLPFSSYCDPLVDCTEDFVRLLDRIIAEIENISASYYELRVFRRAGLMKDDRLRRHNYYKIHVLDTTEGFEKARISFHKKSIVSSVNKSLRCGVIVRRGRSEIDLRKYYFLHATTRKQLGFPIQPYRFFENIWEILHPQGYSTLLLAEYDRKAIAGAVFFKYKDTVSYEHSASNQKYLKLRPNNLIVWKAIEMACSEGYHYFDFGKTPPENKGLLDFKRRWGARMYDLPYFYYPQIKGAMSLEQNDLKFRLFRSIEKHMPLPVAKAMGRIAYHHLG